MALNTETRDKLERLKDDVDYANICHKRKRFYLIQRATYISTPLIVLNFLLGVASFLYKITNLAQCFDPSPTFLDRENARRIWSNGAVYHSLFDEYSYNVIGSHDNPCLSLTTPCKPDEYLSYNKQVNYKYRDIFTNTSNLPAQSYEPKWPYNPIWHDMYTITNSSCIDSNSVGHNFIDLAPKPHLGLPEGTLALCTINSIIATYLLLIVRMNYIRYNFYANPDESEQNCLVRMREGKNGCMFVILQCIAKFSVYGITFISWLYLEYINVRLETNLQTRRYYEPKDTLLDIYTYCFLIIFLFSPLITRVLMPEDNQDADTVRSNACCNPRILLGLFLLDIVTQASLIAFSLSFYAAALKVSDAISIFTQSKELLQAYQHIFNNFITYKFNVGFVSSVIIDIAAILCSVLIAALCLIPCPERPYRVHTMEPGLPV